MGDYPKYTIGKNPPKWAKDEMRSKNIRIFYNDGEVDYVMVKTPDGTVYAGKGDVIELNESGLKVL